MSHWFKDPEEQMTLVEGGEKAQAAVAGLR